MSVLNLSQCDSQMLTFYGDTDIVKLAEHFGLDPDETLSEWTEVKHIFQNEFEKCSVSYLLICIKSKKITLGLLFPNTKKNVYARWCVSLRLYCCLLHQWREFFQR